uniref:Foot protein 13 n=1 Tax=Mytilus californianus TaxID=6549 RepID=A0A223HCL7_MYTCA|nr:foot protein 13 [Mytilus californianus]
MAQGIYVLLLVVIATVATYGYGSYPKKVPSPAIYRGGNYGLAYYNRYNGFKIRRSIFYYNGIGYKLTCNKTRFYRLWGSCYSKNHSRSRCFRRFLKQRLFAIYKANSYPYRPKKIVLYKRAKTYYKR